MADKDKGGKAASGAASGAAAGTAVLPGWGTVIGGAIGLAGGLMSGDDPNAGEANNLAKIQYEIMNNLAQVPAINRPLVLEKYRQIGVLTPEMEQDIQTKFQQIEQTDPSLRKAQLSALGQMAERAKGGLSASDRMMLNQVQSETQQAIQGKNEQIKQSMQARGMGGAGAEIASHLQNSQSGANRASQAGLQIAGQASQNALQAASQYGNFAGQMSGQEFGQNQARAQAQNEMNRFTTQDQSGRQQRNVAAANTAQAGNLTNAQNVANANVTNANAEQRDQINREMQKYNATVAQQTARAGAAGTMQSYLTGVANQNNQGKENQIGGLAQMGQSLYGAFSAPKQAAYDGGEIKDFRAGGQVPGKAPFAGDDPRNDIVDAKLSPNEIVIPRSMAQSKFGKHLLKLIDAHNNLKKHLNEG